jgi:GT2 family glycosyltransferase
VLCGDGNLYWSGGMRWAFAEALQEDFDYYFWLNDDTFLESGAIALLVATHRQMIEQGNDRAIIAGSLRDPDSGRLTYGGVARFSRIHPLKFRLIPPVDIPLSCDTANGNAVLIPRSVTRIVGNISPSFTHGMGDFDYSLRARAAGCSVWIAPGFIGTCRRNEVKDTFLDSGLSLRQRLRKMLTMKGLPAREYRYFAHTHGGPLWPLLWGLPYLRITMKSLFRRK